MPASQPVFGITNQFSGWCPCKEPKTQNASFRDGAHSIWGLAVTFASSGARMYTTGTYDTNRHMRPTPTEAADEPAAREPLRTCEKVRLSFLMVRA